jgi:mono/diheme cytochrome c family protein
MSKKKATPSLVPPLGGAVVGIAVFLGVNITTGRAIVPTAESVTNISHGLSPVVRPAEETASAGPTETGPYQTICITCHQAEGQGIPGAFPPLAGSEWLLGNPEVPVRVVLLGLTGPIEVKGAKFNSAMPPPPGLTDENIAAAITYARTHFGNHASEVRVDLVKAVRGALAGRTTSWTASELAAMRDSAGAEGAQGGASAPGADKAPAAEPAPAEPPHKKAKSKGPAKAPAQ